MPRHPSVRRGCEGRGRYLSSRSLAKRAGQGHCLGLLSGLEDDPHGLVASLWAWRRPMMAPGPMKVPSPIVLLQLFQVGVLAHDRVSAVVLLLPTTA